MMMIRCMEFFAFYPLPPTHPLQSLLFHFFSFFRIDFPSFLLHNGKQQIDLIHYAFYILFFFSLFLSHSLFSFCHFEQGMERKRKKESERTFNLFFLPFFFVGTRFMSYDIFGEISYFFLYVCEQKREKKTFNINSMRTMCAHTYLMIVA